MCNDSQKFFAKSCTTKLAVYACSKLTSSYVYQATHTVFQHNNINRRTAVAFSRFSVGTDRCRQSVEITNARKPTDALQDRTSSTWTRRLRVRVVACARAAKRYAATALVPPPKPRSRRRSSQGRRSSRRLLLGARLSEVRPVSPPLDGARARASTSSCR